MTRGVVQRQAASRRAVTRRAFGLAAAACGGAAGLPLLAGCVSLGLGDEPAAHSQFQLYDAAGPGVRLPLPQPLVDALLLQAESASALADAQALAYSRRAHEFAFYQRASWVERPQRGLPQLLLQRLRAHGVARAVGLLGDPLSADWLLSISVDALFHDIRVAPGVARAQVTARLFDRPRRTLVGERRFEAEAPCERADSAAAAQALSMATSKLFDALVPWLDQTLREARTGHSGSREAARP